MQPNGNMSNVAGVGGVQLFGGVGAITGATRPNFGIGGMGNAAMVPADDPASNNLTYTGPLSSKSYLGEPFAVWLGLILFLVGLRFFTHRTGRLGEVAHMRIGGYNFLAVGVSAAIFFALVKIIF